MKDFLKILKYVVPYKLYLILNIVLNFLSTIFGNIAIVLTIPVLQIIFKQNNDATNIAVSSNFLSRITSEFSLYLSSNYTMSKSILIIGLVLVVMTIFKTTLLYLSNYFMAPVRNGVIRDFRNKIYDKTLRLSLSYYSEEKKGDIMARMTNDVQDIEWSVLGSLEMLFRDPIKIIISIIFLLFISIKLTIFVFVLLPVSGLIIGYIGKSLKKESKKGQDKMGELLSLIEETLSGLRIIKAFNAENKTNEKFNTENNLYTIIMNKITRKRYLASPVSELLSTIVMVIILWYGGSLVLSNNAGLNAAEFLTYLVVFSQIIAPVKSFSSAIYNIKKGLASLDRINNILFAKITIKDTENAVSINEFKSNIEYKNISFAYKKETVLKNVSLTLQKGKTLALVGQSGSGKSTLVDLLPRFYDVNIGNINIDGQNIKDYKIKDLRALMGNVNQEAILFNDTFFNNIAFGVANATEEEVIAAAKVANAHEFIKDSENGYYTNIGDRGGKLSGGQKQRVSIARAVLKNPPILILDEATSALDTESEKLVQEALGNLMKNRTSIVIAHRLSTVKSADEICVLHDGQIVERGKHDELLKLNGVYSKLYNLQIY